MISNDNYYYYGQYHSRAQVELSALHQGVPGSQWNGYRKISITAPLLLRHHLVQNWSMKDLNDDELIRQIESNNVQAIERGLQILATSKEWGRGTLAEALSKSGACVKTNS